jgi:hypothetical protein
MLRAEQRRSIIRRSTRKSSRSTKRKSPRKSSRSTKRKSPRKSSRSKRRSKRRSRGGTKITDYVSSVANQAALRLHYWLNQPGSVPGNTQFENLMAWYLLENAGALAASRLSARQAKSTLTILHTASPITSDDVFTYDRLLPFLDGSSLSLQYAADSYDKLLKYPSHKRSIQSEANRYLNHYGNKLVAIAQA